MASVKETTVKVTTILASITLIVAGLIYTNSETAPATHEMINDLIPPYLPGF